MKHVFAFLVGMFHLAAWGQDVTGAYNKDRRSGCLLWCPYPQQTVVWDGDCKDKMADGFGHITWTYGTQETGRYEGYVKNGKPHGQGLYTYADGGKLQGNFVEGEFLNLDEPYLKKLTRNSIAITDSTDIYVGDGNAKSLYYHLLLPEGEAKGALVLLSGAWETTAHVLSATKELSQLAVDNGLAVIVPSVNQHIMLTRENLDFLNAVFADAIAKYRLPKDKFVLGGLSMGGHMSVRYTELALEDASQTVVIPKAVFNVDGPIDLENLYNKWQQALLNERNTNKYEPEYAIRELEKFTGGSPEKFHEKYVWYSVYSTSEKNGGNARFLAHIPIRTYNDVDVNWWITNRGVDLYGMNALDQSAMVNYLIGIGNTRAEFINAYGKGYRLEGYRHPHSWSIVDAKECIPWVLKCLE